MGQALTLQQVNYRLQIQYNERAGVPHNATKSAGVGYLLAKRSLIKNLSGKEDFQTPLVSSLPGAGGRDLPSAIATSAGIAGIVWEQQDYAVYRGRAEWTWKVMFGTAGGNKYVLGGNVIKRNMDGTAQRAENLHSKWFYGDGGAALSKLDPDAAIAVDDTVLQLLLPRDVINFSSAVRNQKTGVLEGGDTIEFSVDKGTPTDPAKAGPRNFSARVVGTNRTKGTLTLDTPIPDGGGGVAIIRPGDYVFVKNTISSMMVGLDGWNPTNGSAAFLDQPFSGIVRSSQPEELAGLRVVVPTGQDPYSKLVKIFQAMMVNGCHIDVLVTTPEEWANFQNSMEALARHGGQMVMGSRDDRSSMAIQPRAVDKLKYTTDGRGSTLIDRGRYTYSYGLPMALKFPGPFGPVYVCPDEYLSNIDGGPKEQNIYRGWKMSEFVLRGTVEGTFSWVDLDGTGVLTQHTDKEVVSASYSTQLITTAENSLNLLVAGTGGADGFITPG